MVPLVLALLSGCAGSDLPQEWFLDRTRILAVSATPAEPRPGDTVTFQALTWSEEGEEGLRWSIETPPVGVFAEQPGPSATYTVPEELLDVLSLEELSEGLDVPVQIDAWPLSDPEGDVEHAVKYVPVSLAQTPNHNPDVAQLDVGSDRIWDGGTIQVAHGQTVTLDAAASGGSVEDYYYVDASGTLEKRQEDLSWRWYTTMGTFGAEGRQPGGSGVGSALGDLGGDDDIDWTAPAEPGTGQILLVVLDGRGGMGWSSYEVEVR